MDKINALTLENMVNLKKKITFKYLFVFFLTFSFLTESNAQKNHSVTEINGTIIPVNDSYPNTADVEIFVTPYRNHINNDLSSVLAKNPVTQDKTIGKWESNIGNMLAACTFNLSAPIFEKREGKKLDGCMLNQGGIRSIIPMGDVTTKTGFDIMPFENSVMIVGVTGKEIKDLAAYMLKEKKPHPLYGIVIYTDASESTVTKVEVNNSLVDENKTYYIATSDYLANGGDNMNFFKNSIIKYDLDYKLRNLFIDYFKSVDTLPNLTTKHVINE